jgi:TonB-linked SusC/RagA family outer membrane protein
MAAALQGIMSGVNVRQKVSRPGYSASVDIRGASMGTFSSNSALVLIDGIPGSIDDVNPNDVEHISVLKDAVAAAIYGSRATGGVVLINTKKGASGKATVTYEGTFGVQHPTLMDWKNELLDTQTWMRAFNEAQTNDGSAITYPDDVIAQYDGSDPAKPARTQWADFLETPLQHQHNISVRGGTDVIKAYFSAGYLSQEGVLPLDSYGKYTFLGNVNWNPFERFEIDVNTFYMKENTERPHANSAQMRAMLNQPSLPVATPEGYWYSGVWGNPVQTFAEGGNQLNNWNRYRLSAAMKLEVLKDLFLKYTVSSSNLFNSSNDFYPVYPRYDTAGNILGTTRTYVTASESWGTTQYLSHLFSLDYAAKFGDHTLTVFAGFQTEQNRYDGISASRSRFINNELRELAASVGSGTDFTGNSSAEEWAMASLIGRADYAFKDRYLLGAVVRYDGSSRFSPRQRWGLFPSVSAGWRIREESFLREVDWLSNLKLRASWGQLGNQGTSLYPFATTVSASQGSVAFGNGTVTTTSVGTPADLNLSWERKTTTNVAIDFGFLSNRLTGSFDWFYDRTKDIIGTPVTPSTFGASAPVQNTYTIDNRGWELELKWMDKIGDVTYYVGGNISDFRDKVVSLGGLGSVDSRFDIGSIVYGGRSSQNYYATYDAEGRARNGLYLYQTDGLFVDQAEIDAYIKPSAQTKPGDIKFIDRNGDGELNSDDEYLSKKTTTAHYFYGFNFGGEYKGFDLSVIFSGVGERWTFRNLDGHYITGNRVQTNLFRRNYENRWSYDHPDKWADQPRLTVNNWLNGDFCTLFGAPSEYHLRNFGYLRLKNIQIGYTIPSRLTKKFFVSRLRVFFTGENLFYYAPGYTELIDPESNFDTVEDSNAGTCYYGPARVLSGGVSITF